MWVICSGHDQIMRGSYYKYMTGKEKNKFNRAIRLVKYLSIWAGYGFHNSKVFTLI